MAKAMPRPSKPLVPTLAGLALFGALISCTVAGTDTAPVRPADPGYDASRHLAAQYSDLSDCQPLIQDDVITATLLVEPATCPTSWDNPAPSPCLQIELTDGTRQPVPNGIIGLTAAGSPPRALRLGQLDYPDLPHCLPTDVTPPGLIYLGPA